jgi:hypothetical protein
MILSFNKTVETVLNLTPSEFAGLGHGDIITAIRRELGPGDWDERDLGNAAHRIYNQNSYEEKLVTASPPR